MSPRTEPGVPKNTSTSTFKVRAQRPWTSVRLCMTKQGNGASDSTTCVLCLTSSLCEAACIQSPLHFLLQKPEGNAKYRESKPMFVAFSSLSYSSRYERLHVLVKVESIVDLVLTGMSTPAHVFKCRVTLTTFCEYAVCSVTKKRPPSRVK